MAWRTIKPHITQSSGKFSVCITEPDAMDFIITAILVGIGIYISQSIPSPYIYLAIFMYFVLAVVVLDDKYVLEIDQKAQEIKVVRSKLGRIIRVHSGPTTDLIQAEVIESPGRIANYRLVLEFMSDFGYYSIPTTSTVFTGQGNKHALEELALAIRKFMNLKPMPEWMSEANLQKYHDEFQRSKKTPRQRKKD